MDSRASPQDVIGSLVEAYCDAIHYSKPEVFEEMCHENFLMTAISPEGEARFWDKAAYLERVRGRDAFAGRPSFQVHSVDVAGDQIARAHLWVDVPPMRYEDHLGFVHVDGAWKLMTKVFRTVSGPAAQG